MALRSRGYQVAGSTWGSLQLLPIDFEGLFGITAVAPLAVSVYYLCHHVLPRRHPRVISPRDAPSADRASRRTVARARSAENLRIELLSWGVQKPPDHPPKGFACSRRKWSGSGAQLEVHGDRGKSARIGDGTHRRLGRAYRALALYSCI